ncbi:alpha/beta hydrolase [Marinomonas ostreistagni]|nr:alpha/beta hydrolase [Marinomonas ostreistagni]
MKLTTFALIAVSAISSGCTQIGLKTANLPAQLSGLERFEDIAYGTEAQQRLDVYIPEDAANQSSYPVIVFFYGGRWTDGNKDMYPFLAQKYVDRGYVVVIPDYRKYPEVTFPTFVEDGAQAIAWTVNHIRSYQGNEQQMFVMGHSAGAHIGALLAANPEYLAAHGLSTQVIKGFAGLSGPYDFTPEDDDLKDIFGPPERYPQMTVTTFIEGNEPPMLLLWGGKDALVGRQNIDRLSAKIEQQNGQVSTKIYPAMGHVDMVSNMVWFLPSKAPIVDDTQQFFNHLIKDTNNGKVISGH